ncbi:cellulose synthase [Nocardioides sp. GY 10127]|uniref:cellulose synthase n=1 Tax=Nocardioides sp. GY 10127 TaxID=2569762 RepID=UPI0010A84E8F|nr:cellulose synthase [Nocardioides sp. GY 10127]TIC78697.1 cellulose synthase [Nocardioides sp. GY 10127]TIC81045.1 cellulose synthase [Nocardioides sp. GY 10127]
MDDVAWLALCTALTVLGGLGTWFAWRRRGLAAGLRLAGLTLLVPAAYLTRTLRMFTRIVDAVLDWVLTLVLVPTVWVGIVLAGVAVLLLLASNRLRARELARARSGGAPAVGAGRPRSSQSAPPSPAGAPAASGDDDLDEIEALLRRRGIS